MLARDGTCTRPCTQAAFQILFSRAWLCLRQVSCEWPLTGCILQPSVRRGMEGEGTAVGKPCLLNNKGDLVFIKSLGFMATKPLE